MGLQWCTIYLVALVLWPMWQSFLLCHTIRETRALPSHHGLTRPKSTEIN